MFPAKYRKAVFDEQVDSLLKEVCLEMEKRYEIKFVEIGVDKDHVHFLVQSVPTYSVTRIVTMIKSITAREIFKKCPQVKKQLWGGEFWSDGYYASTVGKHGDEGMIARYVKEQDKEYLQLHQNLQLSLFWFWYPVRLRRGSSFVSKIAITWPWGRHSRSLQSDRECLQSLTVLPLWKPVSDCWYGAFHVTEVSTSFANKGFKPLAHASFWWKLL